MATTGSIGFNGDDTLQGGAGNDRLEGGSGRDAMYGGAGNDTYQLGNTGDSVHENAGEGIDLVEATITYTLAANVENLTLMGTAAIKGTGNELNNTLVGNDAANVLDGGGGVDIRGDMRCAAARATTPTSSTRPATIVTETLNGEGVDTVLSSASYDLAGQYSENPTRTGTSAIDGKGNSLANILTGNTAANRLDGITGIDEMHGGKGDDT